MKLIDLLNEANFSYSEKEVRDVAGLIAKAISKMDKVKALVHNMEYDKGRGAGFEISINGDKYDGGSYSVRPNGDVVNDAIRNVSPNAVYAKIGDKNVNKVIKNISKYESVNEAMNDDDFKDELVDYIGDNPKLDKAYNSMKNPKDFMKLLITTIRNDKKAKKLYSYFSKNRTKGALDIIQKLASGDI